MIWPGWVEYEAENRSFSPHRKDTRSGRARQVYSWSGTCGLARYYGRRGLHSSRTLSIRERWREIEEAL